MEHVHSILQLVFVLSNKSMQALTQAFSGFRPFKETMVLMDAELFSSDTGYLLKFTLHIFFQPSQAGNALDKSMCYPKSKASPGGVQNDVVNVERTAHHHDLHEFQNGNRQQDGDQKRRQLSLP